MQTINTPTRVRAKPSVEAAVCGGKHMRVLQRRHLSPSAGMLSHPQLSQHKPACHRQSIGARNMRTNVLSADRPMTDYLQQSAKEEASQLGEWQTGYKTVMDMWPELSAAHGSCIACKEPHNAEATDLTYTQLYEMMQQVAAGMQSLGLSKGDTVALIAENSSRWIAADQGCMLAGSATAVRGSTSPPEELAYIISHAACSGLVVQDVATLKSLLPFLGKPGMPSSKFVLVMWGTVDEAMKQAVQQACQQDHVSDSTAALPVVASWGDMIQLGKDAIANNKWQPIRSEPDDLATLVYTSGTTGHPKGVMLTHGNLAYQVNNLSWFVKVTPGDSVLSLLPPWHIYQRSCTYYIHRCAGQMVFTTIRKFRDDLGAYPPDHLVCVPLVLDTLHTRVMARLAAASAIRRTLATFFIAVSTAYIRARRVVEGTALQHALQPASTVAQFAAHLMVAVLSPLHQLATKLVYSKVREALGVRHTIISGGGSLASHLDDFFEIIGLPVVNGWGLTETSPVLACRRVVQNVRGTVGLPVPGTEVRVVDPDSLAPLGPGQQGLLLARGPGIMKGYLGDQGASAKAFRAGEGWFDTGDLGMIIPRQPDNHHMGDMIVLTGRSKDTIVLLSGKNVEPQPVEDAVCASPLIKHALLMGQDKRELGMLVFPDLDALESALVAASTSENGSSPAAIATTGQHPLVMAAKPDQLQALLLPEVNRLNAARHDYISEQHIAHVVVVTNGTLSPEDGTLTRTMKVRRAQVCSKYAAEVSALTHALRG